MLDKREKLKIMRERERKRQSQHRQTALTLESQQTMCAYSFCLGLHSGRGQGNGNSGASDLMSLFPCGLKLSRVPFLDSTEITKPTRQSLWRTDLLRKAKRCWWPLSEMCYACVIN